ncbi:membrane protein [Fulvitalea axinellae]|uniref:Membrane protein n=1 Tax=Fulvitalea axinellae TaxID=1182444 RepID=A0AAU9CRS4_9BACT|nr:membrane protein [Fulvitalea axinellae]
MDLFPITNDAVILALLMVILAVVFKTSSSSNKYLKKFYGVVPSLLLCYFLPSILNSTGVVNIADSKLYFMASRYLLPASLVLLCLSIDIKAILSLGPKAITMFLTATAGIVFGGPLALLLVSSVAPDLLGGMSPQDLWRGFATVAGSWIGGGANQTAMKEIYGVEEEVFQSMLVVDLFISNLLTTVMLYGVGISDKIDRWIGADNSTITKLKEKAERLGDSVSKPITFTGLTTLMGVTFGIVGFSHLLADIIAPDLKSVIDGVLAKNPDSWVKYFTSVGGGFFWLVVLATLGGFLLSFTRAKKLEEAGASKFGSLFLYVLVATIGMKMNLRELVENWPLFKGLLTVGAIWISFHAILLIVVAKFIKAPFFYVAVGSQANVGGAASAPVVASAVSPSLAPVGVLLAVLGYAVGTFGAIACASLMQWTVGG